MKVQEDETWGMLPTHCFVAGMIFNHVIFELDYKMVVDKINTTCENLIEL